MSDGSKNVMGRREAVGVIAGGAGMLAAGGILAGSGPQPAKGEGKGRMPVIFLAHGSPMLLDDAPWMAELTAWAGRLPRPKSILMISAHWEERPLTLGATTTVPLIYDFYGFPARYYRQKYPAPGAPELAARVRELWGRTQPIAEDPGRGLDHG